MSANNTGLTKTVDAKIKAANDASPEEKERNATLKGKDIEANQAAMDNGTQTFTHSEDMKVTEPHLAGAFDMHNDPINLQHTDVIETPVVRKEVRHIDESVVSDKDFLEKYKAQPEVDEAKYEAKKKELEAKAKAK